MNLVNIRQADPELIEQSETALAQALNARRAAVSARDGSSMTSTERRLFTQLYCQRGRAVSTEQLLLDIWGYDSEKMRHKVDRLGLRTLFLAQLAATVHNLRTKIEESPDRPRYLLNVSGYGYMLARYQKVA